MLVKKALWDVLYIDVFDVLQHIGLNQCLFDDVATLMLNHVYIASHAPILYDILHSSTRWAHRFAEIMWQTTWDLRLTLRTCRCHWSCFVDVFLNWSMSQYMYISMHKISINSRWTYRPMLIHAINNLNVNNYVYINIMVPCAWICIQGKIINTTIWLNKWQFMFLVYNMYMQKMVPHLILTTVWS